MREPLPLLPPSFQLPHLSRRVDLVWLLWRLFLLVAAPIWVPYAAWRLMVGRSRLGRTERFGGGTHLPPRPRPPLVRGWFHGVSVGEVEALAPVVSAWLERAPKGSEFVVTSTTVTGRARAEALYPQALYPQAIGRRFAPLDLPWTTARALSRIQPSVLVLGESELWPSLLQQASRRAPIVLVNARISDRTLPRALRLRPLYAWMLRRVSAVGVQTPEDRLRFLRLGLDESRIVVTGNTKFDRRIPPLSPEARASLRRELGIGEGLLIVAGSTFAGEDELLLDALLQLRREAGGSVANELGSLQLLLAPRHPERAPAVAQLVESKGLRLWRRSLGPFPITQAAGFDAGIDAGVDVVLLDTVGELATVYGVADVAVIGRSFRMGGGQNPLEPMAHGTPVVFGPRMENFREIAHLAETGGAAVRCVDEAELAPTLARLLRTPDERARMSQAGPRILREHEGAAARSADLILEVVRAAANA